jgi:hypothetical protein
MNSNNLSLNNPNEVECNNYYIQNLNEFFAWHKKCGPNSQQECKSNGLTFFQESMMKVSYNFMHPISYPKICHIKEVEKFVDNKVVQAYEHNTLTNQFLFNKENLCFPTKNAWYQIQDYNGQSVSKSTVIPDIKTPEYRNSLYDIHINYETIKIFAEGVKQLDKNNSHRFCSINNYMIERKSFSLLYCHHLNKFTFHDQNKKSYDLTECQFGEGYSMSIPLTSREITSTVGNSANTDALFYSNNQRTQIKKGPVRLILPKEPNAYSKEGFFEHLYLTPDHYGTYLELPHTFLEHFFGEYFRID